MRCNTRNLPRNDLPFRHDETQSTCRGQQASKRASTHANTSHHTGRPQMQMVQKPKEAEPKPTQVVKTEIQKEIFIVTPNGEVKKLPF
jgi:hypothetical protein